MATKKHDRLGGRMLLKEAAAISSSPRFALGIVVLIQLVIWSSFVSASSSFGSVVVGLICFHLSLLLRLNAGS